MVTTHDKPASTAHSKLSQFKYTGGTDTGVNADKQKILYGIVFPAGKAVEVPDDIAHKLRTKAGNPKDEFVEVHVGPEKSEAELQREKEIKDSAKNKDPKEIDADELHTLKGKAAKEDARVSKIQEDAKLGR